jgi:hypothetical protein
VSVPKVVWYEGVGQGRLIKILISRLEDSLRRRALDELDYVIAADFVCICEAVIGVSSGSFGPFVVTILFKE